MHFALVESEFVDTVGKNKNMDVSWFFRSGATTSAPSTLPVVFAESRVHISLAM